MPLFRFHKGDLEESLTTSIIVQTIDDLKSAIKDYYSKCDLMFKRFGDGFTIDIGTEFIFDARCGWYSRYVTVTYGMGLNSLVTEFENKFVAGILSEPFQEEEYDWSFLKNFKPTLEQMKRLENMRDETINDIINEQFVTRETLKKQFILKDRECFKLAKTMCLYDNDVGHCSRCNKKEPYMLIHPDLKNLEHFEILTERLVFCMDCAEIILEQFPLE